MITHLRRSAFLRKPLIYCTNLRNASLGTSERQFVLSLRNTTQLPMAKIMECVKVCGADHGKCLSWLKENCSNFHRSQTGDLKKGLLLCAADKENFACILEVNCETDFAAMSVNFLHFSKEILNNRLKNLTKSRPDEILLEIQQKEAENIKLLSSQLRENIEISNLKVMQSESADQSVFGMGTHALGGQNTPGIGHIAAIVRLKSQTSLENEQVVKASTIADMICRHMLATSSMYEMEEGQTGKFQKPLEDQKFMGDGLRIKDWLKQEADFSVGIAEYCVRKVR